MNYYIYIYTYLFWTISVRHACEPNEYSSFLINSVLTVLMWHEWAERRDHSFLCTTSFNVNKHDWTSHPSCNCSISVSTVERHQQQKQRGNKMSCSIRVMAKISYHNFLGNITILCHVGLSSAPKQIYLL